MSSSPKRCLLYKKFAAHHELQAHRHEEPFLGRQDLCDRAETSGLCDKPICGESLVSGCHPPHMWKEMHECLKAYA